MRGEVGDLKTAENIAQQEDAASVEKQQEILLMNKLASGGKLPPKSQGAFLQKKLQQRKFFDSGDYAMSQDKEKKHALPPAAQLALNNKKKETEGALPTMPVPAAIKAADPTADEEHLEIPRPDNVPQRKASILHPSVHSKLSPQPHIHHEHQQHEELSSP
ncbi:cAMP-regulated phosphoprotein/endosulfine conserved region containing protein [Aphelenchoides avenae]|nr:cAMP-regulated phosphoprotein/endosulfine conserved region containing protein [Aphelenchus avenae]